MTEPITAVQRFTVTIKEFLGLIHSIIQEISTSNLMTAVNQNTKCELTSLSPQAVLLAKALVESYNDPVVMIESLASCSDEWYKIKNQNVKFIIETMKRYFHNSEMPFDVSLMAAPFTAYELIKKSDEWSNVDEEDLPVNKQDIEDIWSYVNSLVRITISYIYERRAKEPKYYQNFDLNYYIDLFDMDLPKVNQ